MLSIVVKERKIPFGDIKVKLDGKDYVLHTFQEVFYCDLSNLPTVIVVIAPTGAGKTFAFTLPIIHAKNHNNFLPRSLVIAPTNALVEDMYNSFKELAKTEKITGNTLQKHGIERTEELINKVKSANIIVTNPDIVNFIIHGGYEFWGKKDWTEFFGSIDYVIFDEYHLYDEEQIANILVWLMTSYQFFKNIKWFFVSATPEPVLFKILDDQKIDYKIIKQDLENSGRIIQGKQKIYFIGKSKQYSLYKWMFENESIRSEVKEKICDAIKNNKKVFLLFDSLKEAKIAEEKMRSIYPSVRIGVNTGFETRQKDFEFDPREYDIVITTSKAEVGVNYPVQIAYIDSGKYLRNFLQRIGRIGRKGEDSEIYCITPALIVERIKKLVDNNTNLSYYEFINILNQSFEDTKLKEERIPVFIGALLWSVYNALKSHERKKMTKKLIEKFPYSEILFGLDKVIVKSEEEIDDEEVYENLKIFWNTFKKSFTRFRNDTIRWKIFYKNQETEYDVIWVLDNAFVEEINKDKKIIVISDFRPKKERIVKGIFTKSLLDDPHANNNIQQIGGIGEKREKEWRMFLYSDHIGNIYIKKLERWLDEVKTPKELECLLKKLSVLYSKKRIEILDVLYTSEEISDYNS